MAHNKFPKLTLREAVGYVAALGGSIQNVSQTTASVGPGAVLGRIEFDLCTEKGRRVGFEAIGNLGRGLIRPEKLREACESAGLGLGSAG